MHCISGKAFPIGLPCVHSRLLRAFPSKDGHKLVLGGSIFRCNGSPSLPQTMSRAMGQARLYTPFLEAVTEAVPGERFPKCRDEIGEVTRSCSVQRCPQFRQDWQLA